MFNKHFPEFALYVHQLGPVGDDFEARVNLVKLLLGLQEQQALVRPLLPALLPRLEAGALFRVRFAHVTAELLLLLEALAADLARDRRLRLLWLGLTAARCCFNLGLTLQHHEPRLRLQVVGIGELKRF